MLADGITHDFNNILAEILGNVQEVLVSDPDTIRVVGSGYTNDPVMSSYQMYGFCAALGETLSTPGIGKDHYSIYDLKAPGIIKPYSCHWSLISTSKRFEQLNSPSPAVLPEEFPKESTPTPV